MASRKAAPAKADWRTVFRQSIARSLVIAAAVALGLFTPFLALALITSDTTDAALNTAAPATAPTWMATARAWFADHGLSPGGVRLARLVPLTLHIASRPRPGHHPAARHRRERDGQRRRLVRRPRPVDRRRRHRAARAAARYHRVAAVDRRSAALVATPACLQLHRHPARRAGRRTLVAGDERAAARGLGRDHRAADRRRGRPLVRAVGQIGRAHI